VREVARQLRDMADGRGVEIRVLDPFPARTVEDAAVELALVNLIANAIKYSDPAKPERFVEISACSDDSGCTIAVRDNGIGLPAVWRGSSSAHFAPTPRATKSSALTASVSTSIVADCVVAGRTHHGRVDRAKARFPHQLTRWGLVDVDRLMTAVTARVTLTVSHHPPSDE
jgi:light-regulated signal transduction histidine kinase (bacteriophytochrome)